MAKNKFDNNIPVSPRNDTEKDVNQEIIRLITDDFEDKVAKDQQNKVLNKMFKAGFQISSPDGVQKIHSKMLAQAVGKWVSRVKPIDALIYLVGAPKYMRKIVTDAFRTITDKGQFDSALRDKGGAYYTSSMYGDSFTGMWDNPNPKSKIPFMFSNVQNSNVYVNKNALKIRGSLGTSVTQMLIVMPFKWRDAVKHQPQLAKIGGAGRIPTSFELMGDTNQSDNQQICEDDIVEIGYFFDIGENPNYTIIAGANMTVLEEHYGDDYPFMKDGEAVIPVMQHMMIPAYEGFRNNGLGNIVYELAVISQQLLNMGTVGALEEALPIDFINVPRGKSQSVLNQMLSVQDTRVQGKRPFVAIEYDPNNPAASQVQAQTLQTQYGTRWSELLELLNRELKRFGINLDAVDYKPNATATEIMSVEQAQLEGIKQYMEVNASEYQFFYEWILEKIKGLSDNNKTPLNFMSTIKDDDGKEIEIAGITLGMVAKALKDYPSFVIVNSRSGAIPSGVMEQAGLMQVAQSAMPGSQASIKAAHRMAQLSSLDFDIEDFGMQPEAQTGGKPEGVDTLIPSETERERISSRGTTPEPAML